MDTSYIPPSPPPPSRYFNLRPSFQFWFLSKIELFQWSWCLNISSELVRRPLETMGRTESHLRNKANLEICTRCIFPICILCRAAVCWGKKDLSNPPQWRARDPIVPESSHFSCQPRKNGPGNTTNTNNASNSLNNVLLFLFFRRRRSDPRCICIVIHSGCCTDY